MLPGQLSTSSVHGPCPHLHASATSQTDLERNMLVLLPPHTPATPHPRLVPHSGSQVQAGNLLLSQSHSENIHLPQRGQPPDSAGEGGSGNRRTDNSIVSHVPSAGSNVTLMGATMLRKGHRQDLGHKPRPQGDALLLQASCRQKPRVQPIKHSGIQRQDSYLAWPWLRGNKKAITLLGIYLKETKALTRKDNLHCHVHCSTIHNSQDMETT